MSTTYRAVAWNPQKRRYDHGGRRADPRRFLSSFLGVQATLRPELTIETLLIRALGAAAFTLLNIILCIGPLARLNRRFLPLLYNRRHLGVMMFTLALAHGVFSIVQFHSARDAQPARQRARRQRSVHDDQSDSVPAVRSGRAHHPVSDGRDEPRLLAAQPHGARCGRPCTWACTWPTPSSCCTSSSASCRARRACSWRGHSAVAC